MSPKRKRIIDMKVKERVNKRATIKKPSLIKSKALLEKKRVKKKLIGRVKKLESLREDKKAASNFKEMPEIEDDNSNNSSLSDNEDSSLTSHKQNLEKLKLTDPDFYKYLQDNDQDLLNFDDVSDVDDDDERNEAVHRPPDKLEVASDESDFEPDGETIVGSIRHSKVTLKKVDEWRNRLQIDHGARATLLEVFQAFQSALQCVLPENERVECQYQVEGSAVFNAVLRLCVIEVHAVLKKLLPANSKLSLTKSKNWSKVRVMLREYMLNLTRLCQVTSTGMLSVLLKHVHQLLPYAVYFPNITSRLLSRLVSLWTHEDDVVRVLAFLCLLRVANLKKILLPHIIKKMYIAFVSNSKFVTPNSMAGINFLRQSFAEMFALDPVSSYQHGFLYIRQLSIHLRNAVTLKKKESYQAVYNWQYIQSLHLWSDVLGLVSKDSHLAGLSYPLVQITLGTIKLLPSAQYYPLRFHCIKILLNLAEKQGIFIPTIPFLLEVLTDFDFNRKHLKVSMKPMDLSCALRCSKLQMQENGWKDAIIEWLSALLLEAFTIESHRLSFPDLAVTPVIQLKRFLKSCKVNKYSRQVKVVLDKVQENAKMIETERGKATFRLDDPKSIAAVETAIRAKGTPLAKYFDQWRKIHLQVQAKKITDNEKIGDFKLPTLYKFSKKQSRERENEEGPVELFPSDDSDNDMPAALLDTEDKLSKKKVVKKTQKKGKSTLEVAKHSDIVMPSDWPNIEAKDIVEDFNLSDLD